MLSLPNTMPTWGLMHGPPVSIYSACGPSNEYIAKPVGDVERSHDCVSSFRVLRASLVLVDRRVQTVPAAYRCDLCGGCCELLTVLSGFTAITTSTAWWVVHFLPPG
jgi:hypothetical protein